MPYKFGQPWTPVWQDSPVLSQAVQSARTTTAGFPNQGSISATKRTAGQVVSDKVASVLGHVLPQRMADKAADLVDYTPVGTLTSAFQFGQDLRNSNVGGAIANGVGTALNMVPDGAIAGKVAHSIIAPLFHGSPHTFEKFALDKIGTGEGAQAYGHGLYFAENPAVAKEYQRQTAADGFLTGNGQVFDPSSLGHMNVRSTLNRTGSLDAALAKAHELLPSASDQTRPLLVQDAQTLTGLAQNGGISRNSGHLYQVKLDANPEDFLDWDKPLGQQPKGVADIYSELKRPVDPQYAGRTIYGDLGGAPLPIGSPYVGLGAARAPTMLKDAGIPGIRYLDQGSRAAGQGSRNYVVFDPSIIDILNRY